MVSSAPVVRSRAEADLLATVISHGLAAMPVNGESRASLRALRDRARAFTPEGSAVGTVVEVVSEDLVDATVASLVLGVTAEAVRKRCRLGRMPGARKIAGCWLIPASVLPHREDQHVDHAA